jgi:hypothetical protein
VKNLHLEAESTDMNYKILYVLLVFLMLYSCNIDIKKIDQPVFDEEHLTISKSKELGVFIRAYKPNLIKINDSINFEIIESWIENTYYYSDIDKNGQLIKDFKPLNGTRLLISCKGNFRKKYKGFGYNWEIKDMLYLLPDSSDKKPITFFSTYKNEFSDSIAPDSIEIKLIYSIPSDNPDEFDIVKPLGHFYLYKE